ncbi:MAG: exodeoxyribonuclease V subunit beta [Gammaproteobacteria bacterium]
MSASGILKLMDLPLTATHAIEASAGTGKTHTIVSLYLRLLLEAGRGVDQILVLTYTKAATAELRRRIRERLLSSRAMLQQGGGDDPVVAACLAQGMDAKNAARIVTGALRGSDDSAIYTIHGFCQRVLSDYAFEGCHSFESEILPETRDLLREVVQDFWRREFYAAPRGWLAYALGRSPDPEVLTRWVESYIGRPYIKLAGQARPDDCAEEQARYQARLREAQRLWSTARSEIEDLMIDSKALDRNKYRNSSVAVWLAQSERFFRFEPVALALPVRRFSAEAINAGIKKGHSAPSHPFFAACDDLVAQHACLEQCYRLRFQTLLRDLLGYVERELEPRKRRLGVHSYDDLLTRLAQALASPNGPALTEAVRNRYSAALIDEFQDTDPLQFQIFDKIYGKSDLPVYYVGDPKQAIYRFRGADVFAYFQARARARSRQTLGTNWRSDAPLVQAVNALFSRNTSPFFNTEIVFHPVTCAAGKGSEPCLGDRGQAPMVVWFIERNETEKSISKERARWVAAQAVAAEIETLLDPAADLRLCDRRLQGSDIAVLVRTHAEGELVRGCLRSRGIASVEQGAGDVFQSPEAADLEWVLRAVLEPHVLSYLKAALATELLGKTSVEVWDIDHNEGVWEDYLKRFQEYHRQWRDRGFMLAFRGLIEGEGVNERLLSLPDGGRRLTNLLHLAELLQARALRYRPGREGLLRWYAARRRSDAPGTEEELLRLESDEPLVKIVTVHKSKGLEYPIVFCPFLWDPRRRPDEANGILYHDPEESFRPVLDLGSENYAAASEFAARERYAESLRMVYVAVTRAKHRCYLLWGAVKDAAYSPLAWLLHPPSPGASESDWHRHLESLSDAAMKGEIQALASASEGTILLGSPPIPARRAPAEASPNPRFAARVFSGTIPEPWAMTSFSALMRGMPTEARDVDADTEPDPKPGLAAVPRTIFHFPRGVTAGRCLHAVLEHLDFMAYRPEDLTALVRQSLEEHGIAPEWSEVLSGHLAQALRTPLDAEGRLRLDRIAPRQRINELEFHYPIVELRPEVLMDVIEPWDPEACQAPAGGEGTCGYMRGFIDLVFETEGRYYIVDYKSNWLGMNLEDYHATRLPAVISQAGYPLQYLLYTVAVHRYLRHRLASYDYHRHFGGVYYLFLRGMNARRGADYGIFYRRPERALVEALDRYFLTGGPPTQ